jgi:hypothetical protein
MVREIRLNVLPAELDVASSAETVRRLERRSAGEEKLRGLGDEARRAFRIYSYAAFTYVWPRRGWPLPEALQAVETEQVPIADLPAAVTAFAVREAIADHLLLAGFERLPSSLVRPVRLFRRRKNLAHEALGGELQDATGIFPTAMVQGICLADDEAEPGRVGAVLDVRLLNRLDIPLADLADAGIELAGTRLVWRHRDGCRCGPDRPEGTAGRMAGGDPSGLVEVARAGATREFLAACLGPQVSRMALEQYFARLRNLNPRQVHASLDKVTSEFQQPAQQWRFLQFLRSSLDSVMVFAATPMRLGSPVTAMVGDIATPATPTILTPLPAPLLNFRYGAPRTARGAAVGLGKHGPYDRDSIDRRAVIQAQILCPKNFHSDGRRLAAALGQPIGRFPGIERRYDLRSFTAELRVFEGRSDAAYRAAAVEAARERADIVFLIIKNEDRYATTGHNPYLAAKALLANANIASQAVTVETLRQADTSLQWSIDSIALQTYAKIGNVPYVLHDPGGVPELVIGVGRSDLYDPQHGFVKQHFGAAAAFRQDGDFLYAGSTAPVADQDTYGDMLTELIRGFIARYEREQGAPPERLVVHLFKKTGRRELTAVEQALAGRSTRFALVHINRDTPLWLVETKGDQIAHAEPGTVVALGEHDRLLVTGDTTRRRRGLHPLRLMLDPESTFCDMDRITWQVHGFTATSLRGFHRTNEPSTILYGRLLADKVGQLAPYGFQPDQAAINGDRPWFL